MAKFYREGGLSQIHVACVMKSVNVCFAHIDKS
jgi:hypothetical protein